jgi:hypothetical protein
MRSGFAKGNRKKEQGRIRLATLKGPFHLQTKVKRISIEALMLKTVDLNTAPVTEMTQLPGIAKNVAYNIVNHRKRHGFFTAWEELTEVKEFPSKRLTEIKARAVLSSPDGPDTSAPPRHPKSHLAEEQKKPKGYTRALRSSRRTEKFREGAGPKH